jgi:ribonuclease BN (tRNA processing enzyme)
VTAVENSHYRFQTGTNVGKHKSYVYRFEAPERVIVFTGDTGPSDAVTELARGADLLVTTTSSFKDRMQTLTESGRWQAMTPAEQARILAQEKRNITLEDIGRMATRANVKTVVLSHSSMPGNGSESWVAEVKAHFSGQVVVAQDLMEF